MNWGYCITLQKMFLFSLFYVRPGFYRIEVSPSKTFIIDLENSTAFTFRESYPHYNFTVKRGFLQSLSTNLLKPHVHHFSVSESPLVIESEVPQTYTQWILPSTLCRSHNFMHNFGYSFKYTLDSTKFTTSCLFFSSAELKHFVTLNSNSRENTFTAKFVTDKSLNEGGYEAECVNATVCSVMMTKPFFIRLSMPPNKPFNLSVGITTTHYPIKPTACSAEVILELEDAKASNRIQWEKVISPECKNVDNEIAEVVEVLIEVIGLFIIVLLLMWMLGFISFRSLCLCNEQDIRFEGLKDDPHARVVNNPADSVTLNEGSSQPLEEGTTDKLIIQIDDEDDDIKIENDQITNL